MGLRLLTTRLVPSGKQRPVDVAQVVCTLVPVHDLWRLIDPDSFFDLSESLINLPVNYFCPLHTDDIVSLRDMICHCTFVKTCFRSLSLCPSVYLWYIFGIFLCSLSLVLNFLPVSPMCFNSQWHMISYVTPQVFSFSTLGGSKAFLCV